MGTDRPTTNKKLARPEDDKLRERYKSETAQKASMESEGGPSLPPPFPAAAPPRAAVRDPKPLT